MERNSPPRPEPDWPCDDSSQVVTNGFLCSQHHLSPDSRIDQRFANMQCCSGITEFRQYVSDYIERNGCYGRNGYNERAPFIPRVALNEFWSTERIENVLRSPPERIKASSNTIKSRYIVVFSILVFTSQPQHILAFLQGAIEDTQLPLATTPYVFSETSESRIFDDFHKHQWKFCPLEFDTEYIQNRRRILPYHIVPIVDKSRISSDGTEEEEDVNVYEVTIHPKCFHPTVRESLIDTTQSVLTAQGRCFQSFSWKRSRYRDNVRERGGHVFTACPREGFRPCHTILWLI